MIKKTNCGIAYMVLFVEDVLPEQFHWNGLHILFLHAHSSADVVINLSLPHYSPNCGVDDDGCCT